MIELSQFTVIVVGELLLGFVLLSSILIGYGIVKKNRMRRASRRLVERIQGDKPSRMGRLRSRLEDHYGYAGEVLEQTVHDLTQTELRLYQNVINSYLKQDVNAFQQSDEDVENLVIAYQQLSLQNTTGDAKESGVDSGEFKRLEEENERLSEELRVTMDTMGHMLNEYSGMFEQSLNTKEEEQQHSSIQMGETDQAMPVTEQDRVDAEMLEEISKAATLSETSMEVKADKSEAEVVAAKIESEANIGIMEFDSDEGGQPPDSRSVEPIHDEDSSLGEAPTPNEALLEMDGEPSQGSALESTDGLLKGENSLMDELEPVVMDMPDAQVQVSEAESPEADSLEDEWARLLEEDADSAESLDDAVMPQKNRAPEAP